MSDINGYEQELVDLGLEARHFCEHREQLRDVGK